MNATNWTRYHQKLVFDPFDWCSPLNLKTSSCNQMTFEAHNKNIPLCMDCSNTDLYNKKLVSSCGKRIGSENIEFSYLRMSNKQLIKQKDMKFIKTTQTSTNIKAGLTIQLMCHSTANKSDSLVDQLKKCLVTWLPLLPSFVSLLRWTTVSPLNLNIVLSNEVILFVKARMISRRKRLLNTKSRLSLAANNKSIIIATLLPHMFLKWLFIIITTMRTLVDASKFKKLANLNTSLLQLPAKKKLQPQLKCRQQPRN